jgi:hypothetical protein
MWGLLGSEGIFQKPQQLNQTGFHLSHNNFVKATFPKVTAQQLFAKPQPNQTYP